MTEDSFNFYSDKLSQFGNSAQGVGWKNEIAQRIRFDQLAKIISTHNFSINDLGCGTGAFADYLLENNSDFQYYGFDIMPDMIKIALSKKRNEDQYKFSVINNANEISISDYTIASGIFNIPFDKTDEEWNEFMIETITVMNEKSIMGFAFNALTKYSDTEFMRDDLYYSDPLALFDYCKRNFSKNVALLHDYNQYDFTILVRKKF